MFWSQLSSSLLSEQSLSPSHFQWPVIHWPFLHWNWSKLFQKLKINYLLLFMLVTSAICQKHDNHVDIVVIIVIIEVCDVLVFIGIVKNVKWMGKSDFTFLKLLSKLLQIYMLTNNESIIFLSMYHKGLKVGGGGYCLQLQLKSIQSGHMSKVYNNSGHFRQVWLHTVDTIALYLLAAHLLDVGVTHPSSSEPSEQSLSPSQRRLCNIHLWFLQRNWKL